MEDEEQQIRRELSDINLHITKEKSFMFDNVDSFVALSRENASVGSVHLYPFDIDPGNYELWDKVGQIVGNLMELHTLQIHFLPCYEAHDDYDDEGNAVHVIHNWEILTRVLPYVRHEISLFMSTQNYDADAEEIQGLARAIHGHPMIWEFSATMNFTFANAGPWCSALAGLPSLERVTLGFREPQTEDQHVLLNHEPVKELMRSPALRFVRFSDFHFTNALCHAMASVLEGGSSIVEIYFESDCSFSVGGRAIIANALKRNASVTSVTFVGHCDEPLCDNLAIILLSNTTLQNLTMHNASRDSGRWFSSIFLSLGMNTALKCLSVRMCDKFGDELCAAINGGLAKKSTLENLTLYGMYSSDDDGATSARNALSFLRTNTTLKCLTVTFERAREEYVSAFRLEAVKMMQDNPFLESLAIATIHRALDLSRQIKFEEVLALVSALQRHTTLKTLGFHSHSLLFDNTPRRFYLSDDEVNQLLPLLMQNYGLQRLVPSMSCADDRKIRAILRLNGAGRRYLIEDESSISKGVDVLSAVSDDINCVFLHLLENAGLCNRRATETTIGRLRPGAHLHKSSGNGKRERSQLEPSQEPRRRLA
jgi:hypothetical protein